MSRPLAAAASLPPIGLTGLDQSWSRLVTATDTDGIDRTWHVLDTHLDATDVRHTLLCVHGNPSWSYLFRDLLAAAPDDVRVLAVDHLDMGFSERTGTTRRLERRVDDLGRLTDSLGIDGPVVTVAHDWGGPISLGWALRHLDQLRGVVLMNTAVHQPPGSPAPSVIRLVRSRPMLHSVTTATTAFIRGAFEISEERPAADIRAGFLAPYRTADRRRAIAGFVADIPLEPDHPSAETLNAIAAGFGDLADVPVLLLWGAADRVFSDLYLHDLEARLPHAEVHRYPTAGHFVTEDTNCLDAVLDWVSTLDREDEAAAEPAASTLLDGLATANGDALAIAEMSGESVDFIELSSLVDRTAVGLVAAGVEPGDRVALMIPPGIDLAVALMACWRASAVVVLVDSGLGPAGMTAAMKSAAPDHLIGNPKAIVAARALRWPGMRISTATIGRARRRLLGVETDLPELRMEVGDLPDPPTGDDIAAIAFTSGATGPSKGVVYDHARLAAQRDAIAALYDITSDDRLVAAFAPFALYGPMLGISSVVPVMDVTEPATLTAAALGDAVVRVDATLVFASPAALANAIATADELSPAHRAGCAGVRLLLSAGAPVGTPLLRAAAELFPNATVCTPYGMTECLPVANISLAELVELDGTTGDARFGTTRGGDGVCVGRPLDGVDVMIRPVDSTGAAVGDLTGASGTFGEIVVRAAHARLGYDRLWHTQFSADRPIGWHSTGDVGSIDLTGRLWIGGRLGHVITTVDGPVAPVRLEQVAERIDGVHRAAVVGVGPTGAQEIVIVLERAGISSTQLAGLATIDRVRAAIGEPVVAVFEVPRLPVDRRHNSKVDRTAVAAWAAEALATGKLRSL